MRDRESVEPPGPASAPRAGVGQYAAGAKLLTRSDKERPAGRVLNHGHDVRL